MGSLAVEAVRKAMRGFLENEIMLSEAVIAADYAIDDLELTIDLEATRYLTLRSPVASDLRIITVAIKASHDLERVGDEAKSIAKKTRRILNRKGVQKEFYKLEKMSNQALDMINRALLCFINEDAKGARAILDEDAAVDKLNKANIRAIIETAKNDPDDIDSCIDLIFISKSIERIADHSTNLAEEVIYFKTAEDARHIRNDSAPEQDKA
jgi:phosphate transport system protein|tara:strand:- start:490 stop:1122 length:633 start_codon:yes stop_codon:yes gene_type:complete